MTQPQAPNLPDSFFSHNTVESPATSPIFSKFWACDKEEWSLLITYLLLQPTQFPITSRQSNAICVFCHRKESLSLSNVQLFCDPHGLQPTRLVCPWDFHRQEYWSGFPFPSPGNLPNPRINPASPALAGKFFTTEPQGKPPSAIFLPNMDLALSSLLKALWKIELSPSNRK